MQKIEIKSITQEIIFVYETQENSIKKTVEEAVRREVSLNHANLDDANLDDANLDDANLDDANLDDANLNNASLVGASLVSASLVSASLVGTSFVRASLDYASLDYANLDYANLDDASLNNASLNNASLDNASLRGTSLRGTSLRGASLDKLPTSYVNQCSRDMLYIFRLLKNELPFLKERLIKGKIDGTAYEGNCVCLVGSLAQSKKQDIESFCATLPFYDKGTHNHAEQWFWQIRMGDTPNNNAFAAHALKLVDMVLAEAS